jgi:hypothetical protein
MSVSSGPNASGRLGLREGFNTRNTLESPWPIVWAVSIGLGESQGGAS